MVKKLLKSSVIHFFLITVAVTCLFPLYWMLRCSVMTNDTIYTNQSLLPPVFILDNYREAWQSGNFGVYFINSIVYTGATVFGIVLVSSLAAFAFSRLRFPGRNILFLMFVAAMMIPLPGSFVPLVVLMNKLGLADSRLGYILCMINVGLSLSILLLKTFFDKMPSDLEDAARIDGCSKLAIWWNVALPLARPAIAVIVIFNSLNVWNEYLLAKLLLTKETLMPLQVGILNFQGASMAKDHILMAGLTITTIPIIIIYLIMQKHIIKGLASGAVKG